MSVFRIQRVAVLAPLLLFSASCRDKPTAAGDAGVVATASVTSRPAAAPVRGVLGVGDGVEEDPDQDTDHAGACAPQDADVEPMQLLAFSFASAIENRNPKDNLRVAKAGDRVYAHLRMRNRSGRNRCLHVQFRIAGKKRPPITLKIGKSWSWRTWAYSTSRSDDRGQFELVVTDDQGYEIINKKLPLVP